MSVVELLKHAKALGLTERIELAQDLWDNIMDGFDPALSAEEAAAIDARLKEDAENPSDVVAWSEIKAKLDAKFKK